MLVKRIYILQNLGIYPNGAIPVNAEADEAINTVIQSDEECEWAIEQACECDALMDKGVEIDDQTEAEPLDKI